MNHPPAQPLLLRVRSGVLMLSWYLATCASAGSLTGLWRFDDPGNIGLAAVGENLTFQGVLPTFSGSITDDAGNSQTGCVTTPAAAPANRIICTHGIAPNGGGNYVNEYTILADVYSPAASRSAWRCIYQTNQSNSNDGDYWIRNSDDKIGVGDLGYSTTAITDTQWIRLVVTFKLGLGPVVAYVNGTPWHTHNTPALDGRFALDPTVLFFSDENSENAPMSVGILAIWDGALTADEVAILGGPGAPVPLNLDPFPGSPKNLNVAINQQNATASLTWTAAAADFAATGVRVFRNGMQIAELPLTASNHTDTLPGGATIQEFTYQVRTYGGAVGDQVSPLTVQTVWNPGGLAANLVAYYRFEGDYADSAPDGTPHDGTPAAAPRMIADGKVGRGLEFNDMAAPHQMVNLGSPTAFQFGASQDFAVSFWLKHPFDAAASHTAFGGNDGNGTVIGNKNWLSGVNPGWTISLKSDGGLTFNVGSGSSRKDVTIGVREGTNAISDGFWHHVVVSCDRDGLATCYLDGRNVGTVSIAGLGSVDTGLPTVIGADGTLGANPYWLGATLDEVAIWRRVLTPDDVSVIRQRGLTGQTVTGTTIVDSDQDGLPDGWEIANFGSLSQSGADDFDQDGLDNRSEYAAATSPVVSQPDPHVRICLIPLPGGLPGQTTPCITYRRAKIALTNMKYEVEHSADLLTWTSGTGLLPSGAPVSMDATTEEVSVYGSAAIASVRRQFRVRFSQQYQGATAANMVPKVEYTASGTLVSWETAEAAPTILEYGPNRTLTNRYEDWTLTTLHQVLLPNLSAGDDLAAVVISIVNGVEMRSETFATETASNYAPAKIPDQSGFVTGGNYAARAAAILTQTGIRKGHALDVGCGHGKLAYELVRQSDGLVITCLETDPALAQQAKTFLSQRGVYGSRVRVMQVASLTSGIRFRKGTFNLICSAANLEGRLDAAQSTALSTVMQDYLAPGRGKTYFDFAGTPAVAQRTALSYAGKWTTNYADNGNTSATDETLNGGLKAADLATQWVGRPDAGSNVERQVRAHIPLAAAGRFFCPCDDEIVAVESRNGFILWSKQLPGFNRFNMMRDGGNMVCDDQGLYVALQGKCHFLDGDTGETTHRYEAPTGPRSDFNYHWGWVARNGTQLLGTSVKDDAFYTSHWGWDNWFDYESGYGTDQVCADVIFARDQANGTLLWQRNVGLVLNVSPALGSGSLFFLESRNAALPAGTSRRLGMAALKTNLYLVSVNPATGSLNWEKPLAISGGTPTVVLQYSNNRLLLTTAEGSTDKFYLYAFDPATGNQVWTANHSWAKADHGGCTQHAVIVDDKVWLEPKCYHLQTGALLTGTTGIPTMPGRPACATWAGGKNILLYRGPAGRIQYGGNVNMWNPAANLTTGWSRIRTSCWISAIPADGMILSKEGGGGCSCGAWMETSAGFAPVNP